MIGIGRRYEQRRTFGLRHVFRDYSEPGKIIDALLALTGVPCYPAAVMNATLPRTGFML